MRQRHVVGEHDPSVLRSHLRRQRGRVHDVEVAAVGVDDGDVGERRTEHVAPRRRDDPGHLLDGAHRAQLLRKLGQHRRSTHQHLASFHLRTQLAGRLVRDRKGGAELQMARRCGGQRVEQRDVLRRPLAGNRSTAQNVPTT